MLGSVEGSGRLEADGLTTKLQWFVPLVMLFEVLFLLLVLVISQNLLRSKPKDKKCRH